MEKTSGGLARDRGRGRGVTWRRAARCPAQGGAEGGQAAAPRARLRTRPRESATPRSQAASRNRGSSALVRADDEARSYRRALAVTERRSGSTAASADRLTDLALFHHARGDSARRSAIICARSRSGEDLAARSSGDGSLAEPISPYSTRRRRSSMRPRPSTTRAIGRGSRARRHGGEQPAARRDAFSHYAHLDRRRARAPEAARRSRSALCCARGQSMKTPNLRTQLVLVSGLVWVYSLGVGASYWRESRAHARLEASFHQSLAVLASLPRLREELRRRDQNGDQYLLTGPAWLARREAVAHVRARQPRESRPRCGRARSRRSERPTALPATYFAEGAAVDLPPADIGRLAPAGRARDDARARDSTPSRARRRIKGRQRRRTATRTRSSAEQASNAALTAHRSPARPPRPS